MAKVNFLTVEETEQIWYYDKGACVQWLEKTGGSQQSMALILEERCIDLCSVEE